MDVAGGDAAAQRDVAACAGQDARTALDREGGHCNIIIIIIIIFIIIIIGILGLPSIDREGTATQEAETVPPWSLGYYNITVDCRASNYVREDFTIKEPSPG